MSRIRIIIAGSREFNDFNLLDKECRKIITSLTTKENLPNIEIISGTARGADQLGEQFAKKYGLKVKQFPADWNGLGKKAGYIRNEQMAKYAKENNGVLIAFWNGESKGTKHIIDLADKYKLKIFNIKI